MRRLISGGRLGGEAVGDWRRRAAARPGFSSCASSLRARSVRGLSRGPGYRGSRADDRVAELRRRQGNPVPGAAAACLSRHARDVLRQHGLGRPVVLDELAAAARPRLRRQRDRRPHPRPRGSDDDQRQRGDAPGLRRPHRADRKRLLALQLRLPVRVDQRGRGADRAGVRLQLRTHVSGLWNDCGANCPYAETIPPNDYYGTRSAGSPVDTTPLSGWRAG